MILLVTGDSIRRPESHVWVELVDVVEPMPEWCYLSVRIPGHEQFFTIRHSDVVAIALDVVPTPGLLAFRVKIEGCLPLPPNDRRYPPPE